MRFVRVMWWHNFLPRYWTFKWHCLLGLARRQEWKNISNYIFCPKLPTIFQDSYNRYFSLTIDCATSILYGFQILRRMLEPVERCWKSHDHIRHQVPYFCLVWTDCFTWSTLLYLATHLGFLTMARPDAFTLKHKIKHWKYAKTIWVVGRKHAACKIMSIIVAVMPVQRWPE